MRRTAPGCGMPAGPRLGAVFGRNTVSCGARVVKESQDFSPVQGAGGSGAWKRTGAVSAPYGMLRKTLMPSSTLPLILP